MAHKQAAQRRKPPRTGARRRPSSSTGWARRFRAPPVG